MSAPAAVTALLDGAKCFKCLPPPTQFEIQTYLIAYISGQGTDPKTLAHSAKAFQSLNTQTLLEIKAYLLATIAGFAIEPNSLAERAKCFSCIPDGFMGEVQTYLLSLDPAGPGITQPNALAAAARGFMQWPIQTLLEIQVYLLAVIAGRSTNPNVLALAAKCLRCLPFPTLISVVAQIENHLEVGDDDGGGEGISGGGCVDVPAQQIPVIGGIYTDGTLTGLSILLPQVCCDPRFITIYEADDAIGTGAVAIASGLVSDSHAGEINYVLPDYTFGSTPAKDYVLVTQTCQDGTESDYSNAVEVDGTCGVATDAILVSGAGEADANGTYYWNQAEFDSSGRYVYDNFVTNWLIEFVNGTGGVEAHLYSDAIIEMYRLPLGECFPCGAWSCAPPSSGTCPAPTVEWVAVGASMLKALNWAARVVVNGGARPSNNSILAAATFWDALTAAGIDGKMKAVNIIAPDSLTAAITPLIKTLGNDPWTNNNFVAGDITVNGLKGNGSTKYLNTGVLCNGAFTTSNGGLTVYSTDADGAALGQCEIGAGDFSNSSWDCAIALRTNPADNTIHEMAGWVNPGGTEVVQTPFPGNGYFSGNRTANAVNKVYFASSAHPHAQEGATATGSAIGGVLAWPLFCHATRRNDTGGLPALYSSKTISFAAMHEGLTEAQSLALYNAVQALRTALGGGYV